MDCKIKLTDTNEGRLVCNMPENKSSPPKNRTGIVSIIKILQHFGVKDLQKIYDQNPETDERVNWDKLKKLAKKYSVDSTVIRPTIDEMREIEYPVIAKMNDGAYIAVGSVNEEVVLVLDPREPKPKAIPIKEFLESWTNEMLIFSAEFSWTYFKKRYNVDWFLKVVIRYKKPLLEVVASSFFLQIMGIVFPLITQVIIDKVIGNNGFATLTVIGCSMVLFFFMQSLLTALKTYILNHTTNKLDAILGTRLFRHLIALPLPYYERRRVGETLLRIDSLERVRNFLTGPGLTTVLDVFFFGSVYRVYAVVFGAVDVNRTYYPPALLSSTLGVANFEGKASRFVACEGNESIFHGRIRFQH